MGDGSFDESLFEEHTTLRGGLEFLTFHCPVRVSRMCERKCVTIRRLEDCKQKVSKVISYSRR